MTKVEALKKDNLFETNEVSSKELFGIKTDIKVPQFVNKNEYCPLVDENYVFDDETTLAILLGLKFNKRVFLQGLHGPARARRARLHPGARAAHGRGLQGEFRAL